MNKPTVGIVMIHGIGEQSSGEFRKQILSAAFGAVPVQDGEDNVATATLADGSRLRLYEAYWADHLRGHKTWGGFRLPLLGITAWLPLLNAVRGLYPDDAFSPLTAASRVMWLAPLSWIIGCGFVVLRTLYALARASTARTTTYFQGFAEAWKGFARVPDEYLGDVFNYVRDAAGQLPSGSAAEGCHEKVNGVFTTSLKKALEECDEVHVVAHSLGTVVAFQGLADHAEIPGARGKLRRLYTLGCPLERFLLLWPRMVEHEAVASGIRSKDFEWHNFWDRGDPVSSRLAHFPVTTEHQVGGHGVVGYCHLMYGTYKEFHDQLKTDFLGVIETAPAKPTSGSRRWAALLGLNLVAAVSLVVGVFVSMLISYVPVWLLSERQGLLAGVDGSLYRDQTMLAYGPLVLVTIALVHLAAAWVVHPAYRRHRR